MSFGSITLRPVTSEDRALLIAIYGSTRAEELAPLPWTDEQKDAFVRMQFEAQDIDYRKNMPDADYLVVEEDGKPAGRLYVDERPSDIRIVDIALLPDARGRGVGEMLLKEILDRAASAGKTASIHVERFNRARALYERLGFRVIEEGDVYLLMEWTAQ